jgi:hypothetical protein
VTGDDDRVIVVRAWRDSGRMIIRILVGAGQPTSSHEWVFADVDEACRQIGEVLRELRDESGPDRTAVPDPDTKR